MFSFSPSPGIRIIFEDGSRIIVRLSGTGSVGATVRLYVDSYVTERLERPTDLTLQALVHIALEITKVQQFTERSEPTVIT